MKRTIGIVWAAVGLAVWAVSAPAQPDVVTPPENEPWLTRFELSDPLGFAGPTDFVFALGAMTAAPGGWLTLDLDVSFDADPFFTDYRTTLRVLPTLDVEQALRTGIASACWSAIVDVDLSVLPWALASIGGWAGFRSDDWWMASFLPDVLWRGGIGYVPRWDPTNGWSHRLDAAVEVRADWAVPTPWESPFELVMLSTADVAWTLLGGPASGAWRLVADASSTLPVNDDASALLRVGASAQVALVPAFAFGVEARAELRSGPFYAYGLIGADPAIGIRAELGAQMTIGWGSPTEDP